MEGGRQRLNSAGVGRPLGRNAAKPLAGRATRSGSVPRSARSLRSRPAEEGAAHFFDAGGKGKRFAYVTCCPVNKNCHQTASITSYNRSSLAASRQPVTGCVHDAKGKSR